MHYLIITEKENIHPLLKTIRDFVTKRVVLIIFASFIGMLAYSLIWNALKAPLNLLTNSLSNVAYGWMIGNFIFMIFLIIIIVVTSNFKIENKRSISRTGKRTIKKQVLETIGRDDLPIDDYKIAFITDVIGDLHEEVKNVLKGKLDAFSFPAEQLSVKIGKVKEEIMGTILHKVTITTKDVEKIGKFGMGYSLTNTALETLKKALPEGTVIGSFDKEDA